MLSIVAICFMGAMYVGYSAKGLIIPYPPRGSQKIEWGGHYTIQQVI